MRFSVFSTVLSLIRGPLSKFRLFLSSAYFSSGVYNDWPEMKYIPSSVHVVDLCVSEIVFPMSLVLVDRCSLSLVVKKGVKRWLSLVVNSRIYRVRAEFMVRGELG